MGDENEMKGKGAVERGTWMLAPEKPSCSPGALGTTGTHQPAVTITHCVGGSVSARLPVLRSLLAASFTSQSLNLTVDGLYVSCTRGRADAQYDASIRALRNCDDLTPLLAAVQTHAANTASKTCQQPIFRKHAWPRPSGLCGRGAARLAVIPHGLQHTRSPPTWVGFTVLTVPTGAQQHHHRHRHQA